MAKELPYFRFNISEWQNGDITLESDETQGVFINICCYYWNQNCSVTQAKLKLRFKQSLSSVNALLKSEIIKANEDDDFIEIDFLDEQFSLLTDLHKKRQEAGRKGGKQSLSKTKAKLKQKPSYKDKDKDKDKDKNKKREYSLPYGAAFEKAWKEWFEFRQNGKFKKLQSASLQKQLDHMAEFKDESRAVSMIENTIMKGYQGLYEPDKSNTGKSPTRKKLANDRDASEYEGMLK